MTSTIQANRNIKEADWCNMNEIRYTKIKLLIFLSCHHYTYGHFKSANWQCHCNVVPDNFSTCSYTLNDYNVNF